MAEVEGHALPDTIHPQVFLVIYVLHQDWSHESVLYHVTRIAAHIKYIIILWMIRLD